MPPQKRVLLHISKYYFPDLGGIEVTAQSLAEGLSDFENIVVCFATNGKHSEESINGIKLYRIASGFSFMSQRVSFSYFARLKRIYEQHKPCAIVVHCPNPFVYPFVMHIAHPDDKIILLWHSDILAKGVAYKVVRPFETTILKRANLVLATSPNYVEDSLISKYKSKVQVLPNGINVSTFIEQDGDDERISKIKSEYSGKKIVFFCGRHVAYKGIDCLIRAERFVKSDCVFLIGGSGPLTKSLKKQVKSSQRIKFLGGLSTDELRCHLYAADVFAFPSVTKAEAFGLALAEAMFCGCPPVCFEIKGSGVNWVSIKDETGEEVPLGNIEKYASAIDKVLSDDALRKRYAIASHERVCKHFTTEITVKNAKGIFSSLLQ